MLKVVVLSDEAAYDANMQLASLLLAATDSSGAMEAMERAVFINPFPTELHRAFADLAGARRDHTRHVREREALVALDPVDKADALYRLALAYRDAGDLVKAKRTVLRALEDAPNFERAQDLLLAIVDGRSP
jgi:tetratricopeptide (TPR) repeat protein